MRMHYIHQYISHVYKHTRDPSGGGSKETTDNGVTFP